MKMMTMRRPEPSSEEMHAIKRLYPADTPIETFMSDPADFIQHAATCAAELNVARDVVLLPRDRPVPELAMKEGYRHVTLINGKLMMLVSFSVEFAEFRPDLTMNEALAERQQAMSAQLGALQLARDIMEGQAPACPDENQDEIAVIHRMIDELQRKLGK